MTDIPVPKHSSTILLVREGEPGIEVFVQRRASTMAFAAGMTVFPGGGMSDSDLDAGVRWIGPDAAWWAGQFGTDERLARGLVVAAVRETFEECGVLLAGPDAETVADPSQYLAARAELAAGTLSMAEFLHAENLFLRADLLRPWSNWITPVGQPRRYDVRFFVAELPANQIADGETTEASATGWYTPAALLEIWKAGQAILMPPTWAQIVDLAEFGLIAEILEAERIITAIEPRPGHGALDFPNAPDYLEVVGNFRV